MVVGQRQGLMSQQEAQRLAVLQRVEQGELLQAQAERGAIKRRAPSAADAPGSAATPGPAGRENSRLQV